MENKKLERQREANKRYYYNNLEKSKSRSKKWKLDNKEKVNQYKREYYKLHSEKSKEDVKRYIEKNIDKVRERRRKYYLDNIEKFKEAHKKRYAKYKEEIKLKSKQWASDNPDKVRKYSRSKKIRYRKNPMKKLNFNISYGVWLSIKENKKNRHWETLVGYTLQQLKLHLEKQFKDGMTWENYGEWHIDHRLPIAVHNFNSPDDIDFKKCWALKNLQPLWALDNISKGAKLLKPFQPSLSLSI
jgi:hypothetical protein